MKNKMGNRSRRSTMAIAILCILGVLSVAYAAFSTNLKINLAGTADNKWKIVFDHLPTVDGVNGKEIFINKSTSDTGTPSAGTVEWGEGGGTQKVNINITGLKFSNLDNEFYYVFPVKNEGTINASLTTYPAFNDIPKDHTYYTGEGKTEEKYEVKYKATFFDAGETKPKELQDCESLCKGDESKALSASMKLEAGKTKYWVLRVYAEYDGSIYNRELSPIEGNTVFEGDELKFNVTPGIWSSVGT